MLSTDWFLIPVVAPGWHVIDKVSVDTHNPYCPCRSWIYSFAWKAVDADELPTGGTRAPASLRWPSSAPKGVNAIESELHIHTHTCVCLAYCTQHPKKSNLTVSIQHVYDIFVHKNSWWHHQMETFSALLDLCARNSPQVNSLHKGQWLGALVFSLICAWTNGCANNRDTGGLRRYRFHCNVTLICKPDSLCNSIRSDNSALNNEPLDGECWHTNGDVQQCNLLTVSRSVLS